MSRKFKILICAALCLSLLVSASAFTITASATFAASNGDRETVVFTKDNLKKEDMRKKSEIDKEDLAEYLKKYPYLSGIEETIVEVQEDYEVNALLLLAIIRLESGNGKSRIAVSKNNLGGLVGGAYKSRPVYKYFDTKSDCIVYMAELLSEHYLTEGGKYFNGYTLKDIAKCYSASKTWSDLIGTLIYEIQCGLDNIK